MCASIVKVKFDMNMGWAALYNILRHHIFCIVDILCKKVDTQLFDAALCFYFLFINICVHGDEHSASLCFTKASCSLERVGSEVSLSWHSCIRQKIFTTPRTACINCTIVKYVKSDNNNIFHNSNISTITTQYISLAWTYQKERKSKNIYVHLQAQ